MFKRELNYLPWLTGWLTTMPGRAGTHSKPFKEVWRCIICIYTYIHTYIPLHYITLHYITLPYLTLPYLTLPYLTLHTYICIYIYIHICDMCTHYITVYACIYLYIYIWEGPVVSARFWVFQARARATQEQPFYSNSFPFHDVLARQFSLQCILQGSDGLGQNGVAILAIFIQTRSQNTFHVIQALSHLTHDGTGGTQFATRWTCRRRGRGSRGWAGWTFLGNGLRLLALQRALFNRTSSALSALSHHQRAPHPDHRHTQVQGSHLHQEQLQAATLRETDWKGQWQRAASSRHGTLNDLVIWVLAWQGPRAAQHLAEKQQAQEGQQDQQRLEIHQAEAQEEQQAQQRLEIHQAEARICDQSMEAQASPLQYRELHQRQELDGAPPESEALQDFWLQACMSRDHDTIVSFSNQSAGGSKLPWSILAMMGLPSGAMKSLTIFLFPISG